MAEDGAQEPDGVQEPGAQELEHAAQESEHGARAAEGAEGALSAAAGLASLAPAARGAAAAAVFRGELAASFARRAPFSDCVERRSGSIGKVIRRVNIEGLPVRIRVGGPQLTIA